jgi:hypothetical protein
MRLQNGDTAISLACRLGVGIALVKALLVATSIPSAARSIWFPISGFAADFLATAVFDIALVLFAVLFVVAGEKPKTLLIGAVVVLVVWLGSYSTMGAFVPHSFLSLLFFYAVTRSQNSSKQVQISAAILLGFLFIAAGLQKLNPTYLSGAEFSQPEGFLGAIHYFFGSPPGWLSERVLPPISIFIELALGFGLLWRAQIFAHLAILFVLSLALVHSSVLYVYLALLPLLLLIDPSILDRIKNARTRDLIANKYFWFFIHVLLLSANGWRGRTLETYFVRHWVIAIALIGIHFWLIVSSVRSAAKADTVSILQWKPGVEKWLTTVLAFVLLLPLASLLGAPTPIGFSMFSGKAGQRSHHQVQVSGPLACGLLERDFIALAVSDSKFVRSEFDCVISGPTFSGAQYVIRRICDSRQLAKVSKSIEYFNSQTDDRRPQICSKLD